MVEERKKEKLELAVVEVVAEVGKVVLVFLLTFKVVEHGTWRGWSEWHCCVGLMLIVCVVS